MAQAVVPATLDGSEDFLTLLSEDDCKCVKKALQTFASSSSSLGGQAHRAFVELIVKSPYPLLQILEQNRDKSKFQIGKYIAEALQVIISKYQHDKAAFLDAFNNFLSNFPSDILESATLHVKLLETLNKAEIPKTTYLALLSRNDYTLLNNVISRQAKDFWEPSTSRLSKEFVLYQTYKKNRPFIALLSMNLKQLLKIPDIATRNNLLILKTIKELSNTQQSLCEVGNISKWLEHFELNNTPADLQEIHRFFYSDFQRLCIILDFLRRYREKLIKLTVGDLLRTQSVLRLLYDADISLKFLEAHQLIENVYKCQRRITGASALRDKELETLACYAALSVVYDIIVEDVGGSQKRSKTDYSTQLLHLNAVLRQIKNFDVLCPLLEDIIQLVFLRWEYLENGSTSIFKGQQNTSRSTSSDSVSSSAIKSPNKHGVLPTFDAAAVYHSKRHGFICSGNALYTLFSFLKNYVTKKMHSEDYKLGSESNQRRFQHIIDIISEALWKYSVLEKIDDSLQRSKGTQQVLQLNDPEELSLLVRTYPDPNEKSSSEDEGSPDHCNYSSLLRRKAAARKKRRRATFSGTTRPTNIVKRKQSDSKALLTTSISVVQDVEIDPLTQLKAQKMLSKLTQRSIIPQMLGTPENLAIMALSLNNLSDVKQIIETFNLKNTDLNRELSLVEHQQQVRNKLASIYANYEKQELTTRNQMGPITTVEQIKSVAAKGFEVSKIISVIDNFTQTQRMQKRILNPEIQQLLTKHINSSNAQYGFLQEFQEANFNAVIVMDLLPNLAINREITVNVLNVIKRQQDFQANGSTLSNSFHSSTGMNKQDSLAKSSLPQSIGIMKFLENLCECMRLLEDGLTLCDMLCNNYYSLDPKRLSSELEREQIFNMIFYKRQSELYHCHDLKSYAHLFEQLHSRWNFYNRFMNYVNHLTKLLKLRDPNLEYHLTQLLKIDPYSIIGELIFECNMTPLEIEGNVNALNLNLVHVIAANLCPKVAGRGGVNAFKVDGRKQDSIFKYIAHHNRLLSYVLHAIINGDSFIVEEDKDMACSFLESFLKLPAIDRFSKVCSQNKVITILLSDYLNLPKLGQSLTRKDQLELLMLQLGNRDTKKVQHEEMDRIIVELIEEDARNIQYAAYIDDVELKAKLLAQNFTKMSTTKLAKELIDSTLRHRDANVAIPKELRMKLENILMDITIYAKVSEVLQYESWPKAYDFGLKTPSKIFEELLRLRLYKLCYKWYQAVGLAKRFAQNKKSLLGALLETLLRLSDEDELNLYLLRILETFPVEDCFEFFDTNKDKFRSLWLLNYVVDFLVLNTKESEDCGRIYKNYKISLAIFGQLTSSERDNFWHLIKYPLLIIEQLIMNARFEILKKVLLAVRRSLNEDLYIRKHDDLACAFCFDKRGHIYDIHTKSSPSNSGTTPRHKIHFQLGGDPKTLNSTHSAFILLNFNLYQKDHFITNECVDLLLRIYATKALEYYVSDPNSSSSERISQVTDTQQSLDSLCGAFQMPKCAPTREDWIQDSEASFCMCCRRATFTMLIRRHHCRRCGRVVCFSCSTHRMLIPELYANVEVRICNDCQRCNEESKRRRDGEDATNGNNSRNDGSNSSPNNRKRKTDRDLFKWQLSGNITHDKLVREEFCYEHAPSVALCLSILGFHLGQQKAADLLLYHCRKLERLIVPNPEVDFELVAKMMNCLALAAKVRGGSAEIETIREHSEIILAVVQKGCESLIPPGPLDSHSLRRLADSLVQAEHWELALDLHLKCGFPTAGVMAAQGLACLRAGCFDTAREKFAHCMPRLPNEVSNATLQKVIMNINGELPIKESIPEWIKKQNVPQIRRPQRGPPLLQEIIKTIQTTLTAKPQPETLQRASVIRSSNTSLASVLSKRKDVYIAVPIHEPALNILSTLGNLKRIARGDYGGESAEAPTASQPVADKTIRNHQKNHSFEECLYYMLAYGSHADILLYLMHHQNLKTALRYFLLQQLDPELFTQDIYIVALRSGRIPALIEHMLEFDSTLTPFNAAIRHTCRFLETQNLLNSLYQLQILMKDYVRASMTCLKFYTMNCSNFEQLHGNAVHLRNAQKHLETELDLTKWENIDLEPAVRVRKNSINNNSSTRRSSVVSNSASQQNIGASFHIQMDARTLNSHINTIMRQLEVAKFLAKCESSSEDVSSQNDDTPNTLKLLKQMRLESGKSSLPTLFDGVSEKILICILLLYCGKNVEEGFGLAYRIIHDYRLAPMKIYAATAKYLSRNQRISEVERLVNAIVSNNGTSTRDIDELLSIAINSAVNCNELEVKSALDNLARKITSIELRISCHIFIGQLKSAYLLANKYERLNDIKKILREAELTNQIHIKKLCEKKLNIANCAVPVPISSSSTSETTSTTAPTKPAK